MPPNQKYICIKKDSFWILVFTHFGQRLLCAIQNCIQQKKNTVWLTSCDKFKIRLHCQNMMNILMMPRKTLIKNKAFGRKLGLCNQLLVLEQ